MFAVRKKGKDLRGNLDHYKLDYKLNNFNGLMTASITEVVKYYEVEYSSTSSATTDWNL